ncbi:ADYC domain-containing protein [Haliangium sp.]|uniref:ADYC domain-containing protein n=1 Tax=Haliangium sp. TaxID=2663208 RepID=UPI003D1383D5
MLSASFTGSGVSDIGVAARAALRQAAAVLAVCGVLSVVVAVPEACGLIRAGDDGDIRVDKHRPQGRSVQATVLPSVHGSWLEGDGLHGTLGDGRQVEIAAFSGDSVRALQFQPAARTWKSVRLHPRELVAMRWSESECHMGGCTRRSFRIVEVSQDASRNTMPGRSSNLDLWLYRVETAASPESEVWQPVCADASGNPDAGLFVDGRWAAEGRWRAGGYTFSCATGVVAKCARTWGYKPWRTADSPDHGGVDLQPLHLACVRAARADYCGDGVSHTLDGESIGLSDRYGFNPPAPADAHIESVFDELGAVHVYRPRVGNSAPACQLEDAPAAGREADIAVWR